MVSVEEERDQCSAWESLACLCLIGRFQDLFMTEKLYRFNGSIISTWWEMLNTHNLFGEKVAILKCLKKTAENKSDKMLYNINKAD